MTFFGRSWNSDTAGSNRFWAKEYQYKIREIIIVFNLFIYYIETILCNFENFIKLIKSFPVSFFYYFKRNQFGTKLPSKTV